jgi:capsular exopolysaccharide synthesis family protein
VVSPASLPKGPSKPNKLLSLGLGLVVSLMAGVGLVLIFENLDTTLFSTEQILAVARLPMLGKIPEKRNRKGWKFPLDGDLYITDAFLRLRTNLLKTIEDSACKSLMVTSSLQGEGKSTISCNLAYLLTQTGKTVVLIDGDLRLSTVHKVLGVPNRVGLCEYLVGKAEVDEIILATDYPGLSVITAGQLTDEPANLLSSTRMKTLLSNLPRTNDFVIVDSPAVLAISDASVIGPLVDGVLLVAKRALIGKDKLTTTIEQLAKVKAKLLGLIINGENISENYYHYGSYAKKKKGQ